MKNDTVIRTADERPIRHARNPMVDGYSLCAITHVGNKPATFAKAREHVNCPSCRVVINFCKDVGARYRMPNDADDGPSFSPNFDERNGIR